MVFKERKRDTLFLGNFKRSVNFEALSRFIAVHGRFSVVVVLSVMNGYQSLLLITGTLGGKLVIYLCLSEVPVGLRR